MAVSNLVSRLATAAVGLPLLLILVYLAPEWAFFAVVAVAVGLASYELSCMLGPGDRVMQGASVGLAVAVAAVLFWFHRDALVLLTVILAAPIVAMVLVLWRLGDMGTAAMRLMAGVFGPLYVGGCLTTLALLRAKFPGAEGAGYVVLALGLAWGSDTGGYFAGRRFGKRKLYEAVSPKKTVEGSVGGVLGALVVAVCASLWLVESLPLAHAVCLAVGGALLGQVGDLGESVLKRSTGVKDSGNLLPGHGGILDRVDALMVTSTVVYLYTLWVGRFG